MGIGSILGGFAQADDSWIRYHQLMQQAQSQQAYQPEKQVVPTESTNNLLLLLED